MQLFALDETQTLIFANHAQKHRNYQCVECQSLVRLRGGFHRQNHFYHIDNQRICRQNRKSMAHIQTQCFLQKVLPEGECTLELRFPSINRIADAVWVPKKIIFEVQCSPITPAEIRERNQDYQSLGYHVVWILHDQRYNQWRLSSAEKYLRSYPHYFTNVDANGSGHIYDQYDLVDKSIRTFSSSPLVIAPGRLKTPEKTQIAHLQHRAWPMHFEGDLFDYCNSEDFDPSAFPLPPQFVPLTLYEKCRKYFYLGIVRPYNLLFQILLERACR